MHTLAILKKIATPVACVAVLTFSCPAQNTGDLSRSSTAPGATAPGASIFPHRPDDPDALYFTASDGRTDISDALQAAINTIKTQHNFGILFIPEGKYLITKTIYIPAAIRLIGYGNHRPLFLLGKNSPGFQSPDPTDKGGAHYMFWFTSSIPTPNQPIRDAGAGTFYSAISNLNLQIEEGNPSAVALRTHFAQHSFLSHVDIFIGKGKAGLFDVGNEMEDVRFFGGDYGIYTTKPSPGWPYMMVDTWFEGQRKAAIRTQEAGLTIVRLQAKNVPTVIDIDSNYHEKLFMEDCHFDAVSGPAIRISNKDNAFNQINLRNLVCRNVPVLASYRLNPAQITGASPSSDPTQIAGPSRIYEVRTFTSGLQMDSLRADPVYSTIKDLRPLSSFPVPLLSDLPAFPPMANWVNLRQLGAKGDGQADDTKVIQDAINKYPTIYVPQGWYRVSATLKLQPNTTLIGLNPIATQFLAADNTEAFGGFGSPVPLLESSRGGNNIVSGIGLSTGASNPRAVACKWMAGAASYLNDVKFVGGHGTMNRIPAGPRPTASSTPAPRPTQSEKDWDSQYWSLWITDGGGGTFKDIWTASTYATAGTYISNTTTPGRIYAMSVEHHVRNEVRFDKVANWKVYALQLEEESRESSECQPMEISDCQNITFANLYLFRVIRVNKPYPWSVRLWGNNNRNLEFLNVHNFSQIKYTTTAPLFDVNSNTEVRPWEFARLQIGSPASTGGSAIFTSPQLFEFAQSPCSDSKGNIYFCESRMRRIYQWSPASHTLTLLADYPWEPLSLSCDKNDNLLVVFKYVPKSGWMVNGKQEAFTNPPDAAGTSFSGWGNSGFATWVYAVDPRKPDETIRLLSRAPMGSIAHPWKALYPAHRWRDFHDFNTISVNKPAECFVAPDATTIIPDVYDLARSTALAEAWPGKRLYTADEYDKRTMRLSVSPEGYLSDLTPFAERGEFAAATDKKDNVYIADGEIYVYDPSGKQTGIIRTPERPTGITYSPADPNLLFVTGHHSIYVFLSPAND